jgi:hypothetical protein
MDDSERERLKQWVETWKRAGPELERIRREELRAFQYEKNMALIDSLLQVGCDHRVPRATSGLVEQQRRFRRLRP